MSWTKHYLELQEEMTEAEARDRIRLEREALTAQGTPPVAGCSVSVASLARCHECGRPVFDVWAEANKHGEIFCEACE